ncbi:MAG: NUDIX hydrolase [Gammaproteobacteria bacterium]|nr:NUDIX hydrolase [Gammaproteobacteria bacterium]NIR32841.1 NUDIX hydrolase [Gammaproteobacteria bacterium]NIR99388.1 NUDIX hydrolase [Gammaproteobacteria bacterium]NIT65002.1 NUDIX hydrolase [Gammaproteobacteria bacterium]NIV21916.1 NUDIX domain-containing protein [Gammaproteobacteria bacterium]
MTWRPNVTVAAVIEHDDRFLMVEEAPEGNAVYNQPAGHLEPGEGLIDAVVREVLEETGRAFRPLFVIGLYRWRNPKTDQTFLRVCFSGHCEPRASGRALDPDIVRTVWLSRAELDSGADRLRSPMVLRSIDDYLAGRRFTLDLITDLP